MVNEHAQILSRITKRDSAVDQGAGWLNRVFELLEPVARLILGRAEKRWGPFTTF
jgi:hypothetical protein